MNHNVPARERAAEATGGRAAGTGVSCAAEQGGSMGSSCSAGQTQHAAEETKAAELCWWGGIDASIRSSWGQQSIAAARDHERRATHLARVGECGGTSSARWRSGCLRFGWPRCCGEHEGGQQQAAPTGAPVSRRCLVPGDAREHVAERGAGSATDLVRGARNEGRVPGDEACNSLPLHFRAPSHAST